MHIGNSYTVREVLVWTRRDIFFLLLTASIPTVLYQAPLALVSIALAAYCPYRYGGSFCCGVQEQRCLRPTVGSPQNLGRYCKYQPNVGYHG